VALKTNVGEEEGGVKVRILAMTRTSSCGASASAGATGPAVSGVLVVTSGVGVSGMASSTSTAGISTSPVGKVSNVPADPESSMFSSVRTFALLAFARPLRPCGLPSPSPVSTLRPGRTGKTAMKGVMTSTTGISPVSLPLCQFHSLSIASPPPETRVSGMDEGIWMAETNLGSLLNICARVGNQKLTSCDQGNTTRRRTLEETS
jgi:hypothetical protein